MGSRPYFFVCELGAIAVLQQLDQLIIVLFDVCLTPQVLLLRNYETRQSTLLECCPIFLWFMVCSNSRNMASWSLSRCFTSSVANFSCA